jgi:hypothetical protein
LRLELTALIGRQQVQHVEAGPLLGDGVEGGVRFSHGVP